MGFEPRHMRVAEQASRCGRRAAARSALSLTSSTVWQGSPYIRSTLKAVDPNVTVQSDCSVDLFEWLQTADRRSHMRCEVLQPKTRQIDSNLP